MSLLLAQVKSESEEKESQHCYYSFYKRMSNAKKLQNISII